MRNIVIRWANLAHLDPSPWVRRPVIVISIACLMVGSLTFWVLAPIWLVLFFTLDVARAVVSCIGGMPRMIINSAKQEAEEWKMNWPGAVRIWRSQKFDDS